MRICSRIWIKKGGKSYLGKGRVELLRQIQKEGSILKASKKMYMSYKAAWDNIHQLKEIGGKELVSSSSGGKGGGGSRLTEEGLKAVEVFEALESLQEKIWESLGKFEDLDILLERIRRYQKELEEMQELKAEFT